MAKEKKEIDDLEHFGNFTHELENSISKYDKNTEEFQKNQLETLVSLENQFRDALVKDSRGVSVYKIFLSFVKGKRRSALTSRPFFRERQETFMAWISEAIKNSDISSLQKCNMNFNFVKFVMDLEDWSDTELPSLYNKINKLRNEIAVMNMPLALSRVRIFWSSTPHSHISYMDLVQLAAEGMMAAIDKYCLPYSRVFRSVIIGRMVGNFIEGYSETMLHFYPLAKRKIYRANKAIRRVKDQFDSQVPDFEKLAEIVNEGLGIELHTTEAEIAALVAAASHINVDVGCSKSEDDDSEKIHVDLFLAPESGRPDNQVEQAEAVTKVKWAISRLSIFDRKLLRLKGVHF